MRSLRVLTTAEEIAPAQLAGATAVVIDVFLATTTLITILENGARRVFPVASLEEAGAVCGALEAATLVRGGEQNALPVDGFDCGPFPDEYHRERVEGSDVVFLTTNGTRAIGRAAAAARVLVASLRNAPAVARHLQARAPESLFLVCAGSRGRFALDDFLGAALILHHMDLSGWRLNDAGWLALDLARRYGERPADALREGRSGRWFLEHGPAGAFDFVTEVGASEMVAEVRDGRLLAVEDAHTGAGR